MRYASIRSLDISNGEGIGVALFTQGCPFRCKNCFNPETHDFDSGKEYTTEVRDKIVSLTSKPYIRRFSILGGEPLVERNIQELIILINLIKEKRPDIKIWLYTGNTYEKIIDKYYDLLKLVDILIDGPFIDDLKDLRLRFRGSSNQRVIDVKETIETGKITPYC